MKGLFILGIFSLCFSAALAQEKQSFPALNLGLGLGIDYGGLGGKLSISPIDRLSIFGALGYNIVGLGYNVGAGFRFLPEKSFCPYVTAMYGYNSLVIVLINGEYEPELTKAFYGPSIGLGFEQRGSVGGKNYFNFEVLVPFRSQDFKNYKAWLEKGIDAKFHSLPIALSIGYHIGF